MPELIHEPAAHRLVIPDMPYGPNAGAKWYQADTPGQIGVLAAGLIPFRNILKVNRYNDLTVRKQGNVAMVSFYDRSRLPLRFMSPQKRINAICEIAMKAYEAYFETDGRPDVVYAQDLLYAGMIAWSLNTAYCLPYVVIIHKTALPRDIRTGKMKELTREVLTGAKSIVFANADVKKQYQKEFADLAAVRNAGLIAQNSDIFQDSRT